MPKQLAGVIGARLPLTHFHGGVEMRAASALLPIAFVVCSLTNAMAAPASWCFHIFPVEVIECKDTRLTRLHRELDRLYAKSLRIMKGKERQALVREQESWLRTRGEQCGVPAIEWVTRSEVRRVRSCLVPKYESRITKLSKLISDPATAEVGTSIPNSTENGDTEGGSSDVASRTRVWDEQAFYCRIKVRNAGGNDTEVTFPSKSKFPDWEISRQYDKSATVLFGQDIFKAVRDNQGIRPDQSALDWEQQPLDCEDGDMTMFNGLLCASGDPRGCDAVKRSQGNDGRWWRSPRKVGLISKDQISFSEDQSFGVFLYIAQTKDSVAFYKWLDWISTHRPCWIKDPISNECAVFGWPRFCDDNDKGVCALRPLSCVLIDRLQAEFGPSERSSGFGGGILGPSNFLGIPGGLLRGGPGGLIPADPGGLLRGGAGGFVPPGAGGLLRNSGILGEAGAQGVGCDLVMGATYAAATNLPGILGAAGGLLGAIGGLGGILPALPAGASGLVPGLAPRGLVPGGVPIPGGDGPIPGGDFLPIPGKGGLPDHPLQKLQYQAPTEGVRVEPIQFNVPNAPNIPQLPPVPLVPGLPFNPNGSNPLSIPGVPGGLGGADVSRLMQSVLKQYGGLGSLMKGGFPRAGFAVPQNLLPVSPMAALGFGYSALYPAQLQVLVEARVTDPGFALHKVAVRAYLLQKFGMNDPNLQRATNLLASRQPENPFFKYLASGRSPSILSLVNEKCPSATHKSTNKFQWTWERSDQENNKIDEGKQPNKHSWDQSMMWECIFAGNLLTREQQTLSEKSLVNWVADNPIIGASPDGLIERLLPFAGPK
jgi:uncharacterized protein YecT (DUF1311 family)